MQVRLFDITLDTISYLRGLDKQEGRVLSLAWHSSSSHLVTGGADSIVRKMNVQTGRCELRITLDEFKSRSTLVWDLKFLNDGTIASADSLGKVQLWNSKHGTLIQSFQLHLADVLTLAVNAEENEIYSSGVDQKVVCIRKVKTKGSKWVKSGEVRAHSHDVRTLALSQDGLLASGGVDTQLVVCSTSSFDVQSCVKHHPFSDSSRFFSVAPKANVLMHQSNSSLKFWQLSSQGSPSTKGVSLSPTPLLPNGGSETASGNSLMESRRQTSVSESSDVVPDSDISIASDSVSVIPFSHCTNGMPVNFLVIKSKGPLHILSSAISQDATLVALSNVDHFWLYSINLESLKVHCIQHIQLPCYKMAFTPNGKSLVLATIMEGLKIAPVSPNLDLSAVRTFESKKRLSGDLMSKHPVVDFQLSPDSTMVATINSRKRISLYSLSTCRILNKLARLESQPVSFSFHSSKPELILFTGTERGMYVYDIQSEHLRFIGQIQLDQKRTSRNKLLFPNGLIALPFKSDLFAVYDSDCIILVRSNSEDSHEKKSLGKKKKRNFEHGRLHYQIVRSNPLILFASSLGEKELVVAEQPWSQVLEKLPPALARDRYGT